MTNEKASSESQFRKNKINFENNVAGLPSHKHEKKPCNDIIKLLKSGSHDK